MPQCSSEDAVPGFKFPHILIFNSNMLVELEGGGYRGPSVPPVQLTSTVMVMNQMFHPIVVGL